jgi:phytoene synthase
MYTVYAFCKAVDSAVDEPPPGSDPKEELRRWRAELELVYVGEPTWPLMISLAHHAKRLAIPKAYFVELIKGVEMDLSTTRYRTFEDLSLYCYRVASIVGLICLHIFGATSAHAQDYAVDLGMAFQLTNILRDLATDAEQGRIYLPQEDLAQFGCSEAEFLERRVSTHLHGVLERLTAAELAEPTAQRFLAEDTTRLGMVTFLAQHDSYHLGQIGFIRRQLGKSPMSYARRPRAVPAGAA